MALQQSSSGLHDLPEDFVLLVMRDQAVRLIESLTTYLVARCCGVVMTPNTLAKTEIILQLWKYLFHVCIEISCDTLRDVKSDFNYDFYTYCHVNSHVIARCTKYMFLITGTFKPVMYTRYVLM